MAAVKPPQTVAVRSVIRALQRETDEAMKARDAEQDVGRRLCLSLRLVGLLDAGAAVNRVIEREAKRRSLKPDLRPARAVYSAASGTMVVREVASRAGQRKGKR